MSNVRGHASLAAVTEGRFSAAVVQAAPVAFDAEATLEKVERLTAECAAGGAELVLFPEAFVSCYPRGLTFGGPPVLTEVSVAIPAGTRVALVGTTGSGKTTLAKLLIRLADPTGGTIRVAGVDLRRVSLASLRSDLVMVPQDGFLFDTSVAGNVRMGRPEADDREVRAAFEALGLGGWVDALPRGVHTRVGERGDYLSVGERQLVALARGYLADPGCLILDEATSAVDPATEVALRNAIQRLTEGRTAITIAHRLATAEHADLILVLERGQLVQRGTHAQLLADPDGAYARLHGSWMASLEAGSETASAW